MQQCPEFGHVVLYRCASQKQAVSTVEPQKRPPSYAEDYQAHNFRKYGFKKDKNKLNVLKVPKEECIRRSMYEILGHLFILVACMKNFSIS